ncbi:MAG: hypothetical protein ACOCVF_03935 [bacterium]
MEVPYNKLAVDLLNSKSNDDWKSLRKRDPHEAYYWYRKNENEIGFIFRVIDDLIF